MSKSVEKGKKQFVGNEIKGKTLGVIGPLVQVALLRADAGKVGVTDISQKNGCLKFLLAQFDMQKVSALYARPEFKGRLKVDAGAKPGVILRLKTRTHVIEQARAFVSAWADAQGDRA